MRWFTPAILAALLGCGATRPPALAPVPSRPDSAELQKEIQDALSRLDDHPDLLHFDHTPAVHELITIGEPALEPTLPYLLSDNPDTRLHAETAIYGILLQMHGFVRGRGWTTPDGERRFVEFSRRLWDGGAANVQVYEAPQSERAEYIERVRGWLASRRP